MSSVLCIQNVIKQKTNYTIRRGVVCVVVSEPITLYPSYFPINFPLYQYFANTQMLIKTENAKIATVHILIGKTNSIDRFDFFFFFCFECLVVVSIASSSSVAAESALDGTSHSLKYIACNALVYDSVFASAYFSSIKLKPFRK